MRTGRLRYRNRWRTVGPARRADFVLEQTDAQNNSLICVCAHIINAGVCVCLSGPCEACVPSTTVPRGGTHTDGLHHV